MPEYLAPGVYVEETSFRAKSIEGVSTSTTAFVGPTRKGPISGGDHPSQPELLTSFGDFVRLYGGLNPLEWSDKPNYLAHAVLNYFNEGGGRLYVLRVASGDSLTAYTQIAGASDSSSDRVVLRSRFAGQTGNGTVRVSEILSTATSKALSTAPEGTLLRASGSAPASPASVRGIKKGPFTVHQNGVLSLLVNNTMLKVSFYGKNTEATSQGNLADPVTLDSNNNTLAVTISDNEQTIVLLEGDYTPAELALAINMKLTGGYARLEGNKLVIGTDQSGYGGTVNVDANAAFGFSAQVNATANYDKLSNNVANLAAVTVADLNTILEDITTVPNRVIASEIAGYLELHTELLGDSATLMVADATGVNTRSEHMSFGLELPVPGTPAMRGSNIRLYQKAGVEWTDGTNVYVPSPDTAPGDSVGSFIMLTVVVSDADGETDIYDDISLNKTDVRFIGNVLSENPTSRADVLHHLLWCDIGNSCSSLQLHSALFPSGKSGGDVKNGLSASHLLEKGSDGSEPLAGAPDQEGSYAAAFDQLSGLEDVSIVAAPGHASFTSSNYQAIQRLLIGHADKPRAYRIAVLETPPNQTPGEVKLERARIDSHHAAMYYPWVTVANPLARSGNTQPREIQLPPSGFMCGIYARNDSEKSVAKAPANEVVRSALRFERDINFAENQMLNPLGINCLRFFPGRGYRVWGARTVSSDPEWKYVNVRRYFLYLESSIDRGTQWAVFENNGERLWTNIRETVESFLYNEWISGNLLGSTPKEAFFVRCDRSTMTQNDLDNGRLICLIGVAALKPAEFVIFRIGQKTADAKS
jgi:phage tail sheath protein FI